MQQFLDLVQKVKQEGINSGNRTGINTLKINDVTLQFDMKDGFPVVTTKKTFWKASVAEMLGFLRGYDNAGDFRDLGCKVWDQNANENQQWLDNPARGGNDDLGRIYGVQAREWLKPVCSIQKCFSQLKIPVDSIRKIKELQKKWFIDEDNGIIYERVDQLKNVIDKISKNEDDRRLIVSHWNPGEMNTPSSKTLMALPPCHVMYKFTIRGDELDLMMFQRSCDLMLGVPFNIVGYSWLLMAVSHITGKTPGKFTHFMSDVHIYENHLDGVEEILQRKPLPLPTLEIDESIENLDDLETWVNTDNFKLKNYQCHPAIKLDMAV